MIAARGGAQRRWPVPPGSAPSAPLFPASELKGAFWSSGNVANRMVEGKVRENLRKPCFFSLPISIGKPLKIIRSL